MKLDPSGVSLTASIAGQTYNLNDGARIRLEVFDLAMPAAVRITQRAPAQNGRSNLSGLTRERYVDLSWTLQGIDLPDYYALRIKIQEIFRMRENVPVTLTFILPNGAIRSLDVYLDGMLLFDDRSHTMTRVSGTFVADDPRLYDPNLRQILFALLKGSGGLPIPFTIPVPIGGSALDNIVEFTYANGDRLASSEFPLIIVNGPIDNPVVENLTTQEKIDLSANGGLVLNEGEFVVIDLSGFPRRDSKTIRNQDGDSVTQFLSTDSDLNGFHFSWAGELLPNGTYSTGLNRVRAFGSGINLNTSINFRYYDRYEGI
jgi:hypothetical protein